MSKKSLTKSEYEILKQAAKIMKKRFYSWACKDFTFGCFQCETAHLAKKFDTFVNFWITTPEEMEEIEKACKRKTK